VDDVDAIPARYRLLCFVNGSLLLRKFKHLFAPGIGVKHASSRAMSMLSKVENLWMPMTFAARFCRKRSHERRTLDQIKRTNRRNGRSSNDGVGMIESVDTKN
jgi:hypothetical protein